ncbi:MAG: TlpA disulfide reductase family protein [Planctomycetota bacterium]|nr:TlpA disulfide reductase family protein [Planctomycetota bacterium]
MSSSTRIWRPFDDWRKHFVPQGARLIAVSVSEPQKVKKYIEEMNIDHTVACDADYLMLNYFQVGVVPTFIVLDKDGKVALKVVGKREMYKVHKKLEEYFGPIEELE